MTLGRPLALVAILALIAALWAQTGDLEYPSDVFPKLLFVVVGGLCLVTLALEAAGRVAATGDPVQWKDREVAKVLTVTVATSSVYVTALPFVGFYLSTAAFLWCLFTFLILSRRTSDSRRRVAPTVARSGVIAFAVTAVIYLCFSILLKVPTPEGLLL